MLTNRDNLGSPILLSHFQGVVMNAADKRQIKPRCRVLQVRHGKYLCLHFNLDDIFRQAAYQGHQDLS
jgi:hypothetical protein